MKLVNGFPRRRRLECMSNAELAIRDAIGTVEEVGADFKLTEAVMLLMQAQDRVADYIDSIEEKDGK